MTTPKIDGKKIKYVHPRMPKPKPALKADAKATKHAAERFSTDNNKARVIRRQLARSAEHLIKASNYAYTLRKSAVKLNKLDDMQYLTEAIAHNRQALAYLNKISQHHFLKPLDQLMKSYK